MLTIFTWLWLSARVSIQKILAITRRTQHKGRFQSTSFCKTPNWERRGERKSQDAHQRENEITKEIDINLGSHGLIDTRARYTIVPCPHHCHFLLSCSAEPSNEQNLALEKMKRNKRDRRWRKRPSVSNSTQLGCQPQERKLRFELKSECIKTKNTAGISSHRPRIAIYTLQHTN